MSTLILKFKLALKLALAQKAKERKLKKRMVEKAQCSSLFFDRNPDFRRQWWALLTGKERGKIK